MKTNDDGCDNLTTEHFMILDCEIFIIPILVPTWVFSLLYVSVYFSPKRHRKKSRVPNSPEEFQTFFFSSCSVPVFWCTCSNLFKMSRPHIENFHTLQHLYTGKQDLFKCCFEVSISQKKNPKLFEWKLPGLNWRLNWRSVQGWFCLRRQPNYTLDIEYRFISFKHF